jgi:phospholipid-binding lipoprotein MlaA
MNASRLQVLALALLLAGCATGKNPQDPMEGYNRAVFAFNDKTDQIVLKPVATAYHAVLPSFVQTGVGNFFGNLGDIWSGVNEILQGKVTNGASDFARFGVNSTIGIGGLFDVGSNIGLTKHNRDFGETLGAWGVKPGPYVVIPLLGSSTMRDSVALPLDYAGNLWYYKYPVRQRNEGTILQFVDQRASVLDASKLLDEAALDRYEFVRDAYLQRRESKVRDEDQLTPRIEKQEDAPQPPMPDQAHTPPDAKAPAATVAPSQDQKSTPQSTAPSAASK